MCNAKSESDLIFFHTTKMNAHKIIEIGLKSKNKLRFEQGNIRDTLCERILLQVVC